MSETSDMGPAGEWLCDKCDFALHSRSISAATGEIGVPRIQAVPECANDCGPMRRLTWREAAEGYGRGQDRLNQLLDERDEELARLRASPSDEQIADRIIEVMNRALLADQAAVAALIENRVTCNRELAEDETIQVHTEKQGYSVGLLGILNGIAGIMGEEAGERAAWGHVSAVFQVVCPDHGHMPVVNEGQVVGGPCRVLGCEKSLVLGDLKCFARTRVQP